MNESTDGLFDDPPPAAEKKKRAPRRTKQIICGLTPREVAGLEIMTERTRLCRADMIRRAIDAFLTANDAWPPKEG